MRDGSDSIGDSVRADSGEAYSKLPSAFKYETTFNAACTCHPAAGSRIASLLHDFTLRRGDAVMTATGIKVFRGHASFPFEPKDFLVLAKSRDLSKPAKAVLAAMRPIATPVTTTVMADETARPSPQQERTLVVHPARSASRLHDEVTDLHP